MGVALDDTAVKRFSTYLDLLQQWGKKINLTSRLDAEEVLVYHFLDSLAGAPVISGSPNCRMVDLGTGAGFPALPLKFALPGIRVLLVESVRKKVSFCQEVIRTTGVTDVEARWGRGEELGTKPEYHHAFDWAISRAVGPAADIAHLALPFLAAGGRVLLYKGEPESDELRNLDGYCQKQMATWEVHPVTVPHLKGARTLIVVSFPA